jgi:transposase-like protein
MAKHKEYTPEYKAKIVIELLREEHTINEIASREQINVKQLYNWRNEFITNASRVFAESRSDKEAAKNQRALEEREQEWMAKVGQLTLENDWLKKKSAEILGSGWEVKAGHR